jgi:large subunit ribosomal protein L33
MLLLALPLRRQTHAAHRGFHSGVAAAGAFLVPALDLRPRGLHFSGNSGIRIAPMAKATTVKIRLVSEEGTGFFYVAKKNARTMTDKLSLRKYDPKAKKHVMFKEAKIK